MGKVIGITGGIASGKSMVSSLLIEQGYPVIDADIAARKVVEPGQPALAMIKETFGEEVLHSDGTLNREKLGAIVFTDEQKRLELNQIVHPAVRSWMTTEKEKAFANGADVVFMDIPLLFESKLTFMVDAVILVYVDPAVQLERLMKRNGYSKAEAQARISSQMPIERKRELADYIIDNNGTPEETISQLSTVLNTIQK